MALDNAAPAAVDVRHAFADDSPHAVHRLGPAAARSRKGAGR
jgi:hypothetical protein